MMSHPVVSVEGLSKKYCADLARSLRYGAADILAELTLRRERTSATLRDGEFWALDDINFDLAPGSSLGVVGRNGAGKSTLLRLLAGVTKPDQGQITIRGRVGALLSLGAGFDSTLTGRENILIEASALGLPRRRARSLLDEIVEFAELGAFIDAPVHTYSDGMRMRLGFAVATSLDADVLLLDEVLLVGDVSFRRKSVDHIRRFVDNGGALVFVSHEVWLIQAMCSNAIELEAGCVVSQGDAEAVISHYLGSLTQAPKMPEPLPTPIEPQLGPGSPSGRRGGGMHEVDGEVGSPAAEPTTSSDLLTIDSIRIRSLDNDLLVTGDRVEVSLEYTANRTVQSAHWGFLVWTADRTICITNDMTDESRPFTIPEGHGRLHCTIRHLPLMSGTFLLGGAVLDGESRMPLALIGYDDGPVFFSVTTPESSKATLRKIGGAVIDFDVDWNERMTGSSDAGV